MPVSTQPPRARVTSTPAGTAPIVEWYRVAGDRIKAIDAFFDARPFAPPAGHGA